MSITKNTLRKSTFKIAVLIVVLFTTHSIGQSQWTWRLPTPTGANLFDVVYGKGFVAVGEYGAIITSPDAIEWTSQKSGTKNNIRAISFVDSQFVAIGDSAILLFSKDGISWTISKQDSMYNATDIAFSDSALVIVGIKGDVWTCARPISKDKMKWVHRASVSNKPLRSIVRNSNLFVVVGDSGTIVTSPNASTWTLATSGTSQVLKSVAGHGSTFVAVGDSGVVLTSQNGTTWTQSIAKTQRTILSVGWVINKFIAVTMYDSVLLSTNGNSWSSAAGILGLSTYGFASDGKKTVSVGMLGHISVTTDALTWTWYKKNITNLYLYGLYAVAWAGNLYVACGNNGTIVTSPDGIVWTTRDSPTSDVMNAIAYDGKQFIIGTDNGTFVTSQDGIIWTRGDFIAHNDVNSIVWTGKMFIAVCDAGRIITSPDGISWTEQKSTDGYFLNKVIWTGSMAVVSGHNNIYYSYDGILWKSGNFNATSPGEFFGIAWSGKLFVTVGGWPRSIYTSPDGITWTSVPWEKSVDLRSVIWSGSRFVGVGTAGSVFSSQDGIIWKDEHPISTYDDLKDVCWNGSQYVVVTNSGSILTSPSDDPPVAVVYNKENKNWANFNRVLTKGTNAITFQTVKSMQHKLVSWEIYTTNGKKVKCGSQMVMQENPKIPICGLSTGSYVLKMEYNLQKSTMRFIKN